MSAKNLEDLPIYWKDHEDVAMKLYERFGEEFDESKIYRIRFTELMTWVLRLMLFVTGQHLLMPKEISLKNQLTSKQGRKEKSLQV